MLSYESLLPHLPAFAAVLARLSGALLIAPALGGTAMPRRLKAMLVMCIAVAVYPGLDHPAVVPGRVDLFTLAPLILGELAIGYIIGTLASLPVYLIQLGGLMIGQQMGLSLAGVYNPAFGEQSDVFGQAISTIAVAIFIVAGGIESLFTASAQSFGHVPIGGFTASSVPLGAVVALMGSGYELAVRVSMPVLCIIFLETLATGFLMKTAPQINILSVGFPLKIMGGLFVFIASLGAVSDTIRPAVLDAIRLSYEWVASL